MNCDAAKLIYFSPTSTTRKVVEEIAKGIRAAKQERLNLTLPDFRDREYALSQDELAIIGMPVYTGRLPAEAVARLRQIKGNNTPAVLVVVYGNRAYEDALIELRDVALEAGFRPIAAGAFIGEHSYSTDDAKIAYRRPDASDLELALKFGKSIRTKMDSLPAPFEIPMLPVPGNHPYQDIRVPKNVSLVSEEFCTRCGACATACPTGVIALKDNQMVTDAALCIACCACVKACTTGARLMNDERIQKMRGILTTKFSQRKEPETFYLDSVLN